MQQIGAVLDVRTCAGRKQTGVKDGGGPGAFLPYLSRMFPTIQEARCVPFESSSG